MVYSQSVVNIAFLSSALIFVAVFLALVGKHFRLPGRLNLNNRAEELLRKTGGKIGNEVSKTLLQKKIIQADLSIQPEYFIGLQFAMPLICILLFLPPVLLGIIDIYWGVLAAAILYLLPKIWLDKKVKMRIEAIKKDIPDFCILLGNALNGAELITALEEVSRTMQGELSKEINRALTDMATGDSRAAALNKMALRCNIPELTGLVNKIQQTIRYGSPLESVVKHHAEKIMTRRKQETQKVAGELTIKMLFPIVLFVLVPLFVLLGFPVIWNLVNLFGE